jgi:hypothetical protein
VTQTQALAEFTAALHHGPGPHASGSPQTAHGRKGATAEPEASGTAFERAARAGKTTSHNALGGGVTESEVVSYTGDGQGVWKALKQTGVAEDHNGHAEVEAYDLSRLLGMDIVPPTVYSTLNGVPGTSQQFIPGLQIGRELEKEPTWRELDQDQFEDVLVLDVLIANDDRNRGNWGLDASGRLWAVDHGHASFQKLATSTVDQGKDSQGPRGLMGTSSLIQYANRSRRNTTGKVREIEEIAEVWKPQANVANWDQARIAPAYRIATGKPVPVGLEESTWMQGWQLPEAKTNRLRQITQAQVTSTIMGERPERWDAATRAGKTKRAANVWANLQALAKQGAFTWW